MVLAIVQFPLKRQRTTRRDLSPTNLPITSRQLRGRRSNGMESGHTHHILLSSQTKLLFISKYITVATVIQKRLGLIRL